MGSLQRQVASFNMRLFCTEASLGRAKYKIAEKTLMRTITTVFFSAPPLMRTATTDFVSELPLMRTVMTDFACPYEASVVLPNVQHVL